MEQVDIEFMPAQPGLPARWDVEIGSNPNRFYGTGASLESALMDLAAKMYEHIENY